MNEIMCWLRDRIGWWRDEHRQLNLQWLVMAGDPTARRPEDYFILWRWWWRYAWKWYILEVKGGEPNYRLVFLAENAQRSSKELVRKRYVAVRIGPLNTRFGLINDHDESGVLTVVSGPMTRSQLNIVTDERLAHSMQVDFYDAQIF